ncbi:MAG TPA: hypothetical protein VNE67_15455 [Acetobacteraceae bacterium]|nr:hypothetical protein [Acetobacteraceae bacterium]
MSPFPIERGSNHRRAEVAAWLHGLDLVAPEQQDAIVTAWVSTWATSPYATLAEMPFTAGVDYPLERHVNEVTRAGLDLAQRAAADWGETVDPAILVPVLILHDVDKPLMYARAGTRSAIRPCRASCRTGWWARCCSGNSGLRIRW